jgi:hypothetical protein
VSPPTRETRRSLPGDEALCRLIAWLDADAPPRGVHAAIDEHLARGVGDAPATAAHYLNVELRCDACGRYSDYTLED